MLTNLWNSIIALYFIGVQYCSNGVVGLPSANKWVGREDQSNLEEPSGPPCQRPAKRLGSTPGGCGLFDADSEAGVDKIFAILLDVQPPPQQHCASECPCSCTIVQNHYQYSIIVHVLVYYSTVEFCIQ